MPFHIFTGNLGTQKTHTVMKYINKAKMQNMINADNMEISY